MEIALTKKLADASRISLAASENDTNPLFCWTANWTSTFEGRKEGVPVTLCY